MMFNRLSQDLENFTTDFKKWVANYPEPLKSGEWEDTYPKWQDLIHVVMKLLDARNSLLFSQSVIDNLLYLIARDNNLEVFIEKIAESESELLFFAEKAIHAEEVEARWQFAAYLGGVKSNKIHAEQLLQKFIRDNAEYVRRRALTALGQVGSNKVEQFVADAWDTGNEYQRMTVLEALSDINSTKLRSYLEMAIADGRPYLVATAKKLSMQA